MEIALDNTKNVIIMGDINEELLNPDNQNLKNVLLINSLSNIITEPTRGRALLLTSFEQTVLDSGIPFIFVLLLLSFSLNIVYTILTNVKYGFIGRQNTLN